MQLKSFVAIWDHVFALLKADATLADVQEWSQQLEDAVPDTTRMEGGSFPVVTVGYMPNASVRQKRIISEGNVEQEYTILTVMCCTCAATTQGACATALDLMERIVAIPKTNRYLSYGDDTAAGFTHVSGIVLQAVRSTLDEASPRWFGIAAAQFLITNERGDWVA